MTGMKDTASRWDVTIDEDVQRAVDDVAALHSVRRHIGPDPTGARAEATLLSSTITAAWQRKFGVTSADGDVHPLDQALTDTDVTNAAQLAADAYVSTPSLANLFRFARSVSHIGWHREAGAIVKLIVAVGAGHADLPLPRSDIRKWPELARAITALSPPNDPADFV